MKRVLILVLFTLACTAHAENKDKVYTIETATEPKAVAAGSKAVLQITITPKAPWVLKTTTPMKITLAGSQGVKLAKKKLSNKDISDTAKGARSVAARFEATEKGEQRIDADMSFFLCTEEICQRYTDKTSAAFAVN